MNPEVIKMLQKYCDVMAITFHGPPKSETGMAVTEANLGELLMAIANYGYDLGQTNDTDGLTDLDESLRSIQIEVAYGTIVFFKGDQS